MDLELMTSTGLSAIALLIKSDAALYGVATGPLLPKHAADAARSYILYRLTC